MSDHKCVYGPVPSRRLGESLGISPIPKKTCNYSCIYCQLGRTDRMTNRRSEFFPLQEIVDEFRTALTCGASFDAVTLVGEGEPTLYSRIGDLITEMKKYTEKPVAVITNGALLYEKSLREELSHADIVLPSLDACDERTFRTINRPWTGLTFEKCFRGLAGFSREYTGELWIETMVIDGINDDDESLHRMKDLLKEVRYSRLYINTPVRPPAEENVRPVPPETMDRAVRILGGISIDQLVSVGFFSSEKDDYNAVLGIIRRHPMNQFEIGTFLKTRGNAEAEKVLSRLNEDPAVQGVEYKGFVTYRLR
ncbi:MAG TPA: radical SAM protein [Aminivibrio sp.]|jgi:wyosine [tRNA(Phe)-imidazoG37] synthetase (radical SAM superfamily)|nr:radical SAM protein [Synergistaceae bacterium]NCB15191.1 radical SAM protein [Synergistales bacterium]HRX25798.1 radical SAM protein [Aminivibrio sp.]